MARTYDLEACADCGFNEGESAQAGCCRRCGSMSHEITDVTAIDKRDVEPLVAAARDAHGQLAEAQVLLDHAGEQVAASDTHRAGVELGRALATFEEGDQDG